MEAFRFGFAPDTPPAFKFDPTDDDIVAHYLLPRALGIPNPPFAHAVLDDNPASLPPPDLLARHGHADSHHAFFLDVTKNGGRRERVIKGGNGGIWRGQQGQCHTLTLLSPSGHEVNIKYKRYDLTFKKFDDDDDEQEVKGKNKRKRKDGSGGAPSGWVMHEYTIVNPPLQNTVLSRIHLTKGKIKENQLQAAGFDQHQHFFPAPQQLLGPSYYYQHDFPHQQQHPDPSYYYQDDFPYQEQQAGPSHHQDFPYQGQAGPSTGFSDGSQPHDASFYREEFPYHEQAGPSYQGFPVPEQPGPSYYHHPADGGGKAEDASFYGEEIPYQQHAPPSYQGFPMPEQPVPSYYNHPANVMAGGEGFSDGIQADDASFYAHNGDAAEDGFVNLLCAGEGEADNNTDNGHNLYEDGLQSTSGGNIECAHGLPATQETFPPKPDS